MAYDQVLLIGLLLCVACLFAWGRLRYDVVAFLALQSASRAGRREEVRARELLIVKAGPDVLDALNSARQLNPARADKAGPLAAGDVAVAVPMVLWVWPL